MVARDVVLYRLYVLKRAEGSPSEGRLLLPPSPFRAPRGRGSRRQHPGPSQGRASPPSCEEEEEEEAPLPPRGVRSGRGDLGVQGVLAWEISAGIRCERA